MGFAYANGTLQRQPLDSIVTPRDESAYLKVQRFEAISEVVSSATKITCLDKKDHHPFPFSMFFWGVPCWISKKDVCLEDSVFRIFLFYHQKLGENDPIWQAICLKKEWGNNTNDRCESDRSALSQVHCSTLVPQGFLFFFLREKIHENDLITWVSYILELPPNH